MLATTAMLPAHQSEQEESRPITSPQKNNYLRVAVVVAARSHRPEIRRRLGEPVKETLTRTWQPLRRAGVSQTPSGLARRAPSPSPECVGGGGRLQREGLEHTSMRIMLRGFKCAARSWWLLVLLRIRQIRRPQAAVGPWPWPWLWRVSHQQPGRFVQRLVRERPRAAVDCTEDSGGRRRQRGA